MFCTEKFIILKSKTSFKNIFSNKALCLYIFWLYELFGRMFIQWQSYSNCFQIRPENIIHWLLRSERFMLNVFIAFLGSKLWYSFSKLYNTTFILNISRTSTLCVCYILNTSELQRFSTIKNCIKKLHWQKFLNVEIYLLKSFQLNFLLVKQILIIKLYSALPMFYKHLEIFKSTTFESKRIAAFATLQWKTVYDFGTNTTIKLFY